MSKNKVENKMFLGMEVRVVNNEYIDKNEFVYIIVFDSNKFKIGATRDFNKRLSYYKPYKYMIKDIVAIKTNRCFEYEWEILKILKRCGCQAYHGQEWFHGEINAEEFIDIFNNIELLNDNEKNNKGVQIMEYSKEEIVMGLNLLFPNKKRLEFEYILEIIKAYNKTYNHRDNITKFIDFYKELDESKKIRIVNVLIISNVTPDELFRRINVLMDMSSNKFIFGSVLFLEKFLSDFPNLEVREFVMQKFINAFEFTGSHKQAGEMALKLALKKYDLN